MKTLLICGATGFLGRNILEYFHKTNEYKIRATYHIKPAIDEYKRVEWVKCDLRNPEDVKNVLQDVNIVCQFAATTSGAKDILARPYIHVTDNAVMNSLILREAFENNIEHFIFPSCTVMYQSNDDLIKETDFNPSDDMPKIYFGAAHTKVYLENICKFYSNFNRTKFTVIRHSNIYGPYDKYDLEKSHVFGATVNKVMNSTDGNITVWGEGLEKRDLLYVEDFIEFIDLALKKQNSNFEIFNVGLGSFVSIKELVDKIIFHCKINLNIVHDLSKPSIPTSICLDCSKAKSLLGWTPKHSLDQGIIKTINWYKQWKSKT